jgi:hypothetical protein
LKPTLLIALAAALAMPAAICAAAAPDIEDMPLHAAPAGKTYHLMPDVTEQQPGNGAPIYMVAAQRGPDDVAADAILGKLQDVDLPMAELAKKDIDKELAPFAERIALVDIAARREYASWDWTLREQGIALSLPYLNQMRRNANILSQRARWQIARHDWDGAAHTLQTGFAMAGHLREHALLIQGLVQIGIQWVFLERVREWTQEPGAPNLYWALTDLPTPMADMHAISQWEQAMLYFTFPQLDPAKRSHMSAQDWSEVFKQVNKLDTWNPKQALTRTELAFRVAAAMGDAKRALAASGIPQKELDAMTVNQLVGLYWADDYDRAAAAAWQAWQLPWWQADSRLPAIKPDSIDAGEREKKSNPFLSAIEPTRRSRLQFARIERNVEALQIIESIRAYAGKHDGKLPASLDDLTDMPVPTDAVTGKPFIYHTDGASATLELTSDDPKSPGTNYHITFSR